jgi:hypothetical protein
MSRVEAYILYKKAWGEKVNGRTHKNQLQSPQGNL